MQIELAWQIRPPLEVCVGVDLGHRQQRFAQALGSQHLGQELTVFLLRRPAIRCGAALQPLHQVLVEVAQRLDDIYSARPSELDGDLVALQALAIDEDR